MFSLLLDEALDSLVEEDRPRAIDPSLCMKLADERETLTPELILSFQIGPSSLQQDVLHIRNAGGGRLVSRRFIELLNRESVPFTAYPTDMIDRHTRQSHPVSYFFWIPKRIPRDDAIDWEACEEYVDRETGVRKLTKLVLKEDFIKTAPLLFVAGGRYLIHDTLQMQLREAAITGIATAPLDSVFATQSGVKRTKLEHALQEDQDNWTLWLELSGTLKAARRFQEALTALERALALKPDLREAWERRADIFSSLGLWDRALESLKRAIQLKPTPQIRSGERALPRKPEEIPDKLEYLLELSAWVKYTNTLQEIGRKEEALASANYLVRTWERSPLSWYALGKAYLSAGQDELALQAIDTGFSVMGGPTGPHLEEIHRIRGEILYRLGRYQEALTAYQAGLASRTTYRELYVGKIKALQALGQYKKAAKAERELQDLNRRREENLRKKPT